MCKLGERVPEGSSTSSGGGGGYLNEESILDLGKALYKLHLQLLLLVEAVAKMYTTLSNSAADNKASVVSVIIVPTARSFLFEYRRRWLGFRHYRLDSLQTIIIERVISSKNSEKIQLAPEYVTTFGTGNS